MSSLAHGLKCIRTWSRSTEPALHNHKVQFGSLETSACSGSRAGR